jgi:futalosine hydrolase
VILIVCAVAKELSFLAPQPHVEVLVTGVGPVEAANHVSRALALGTYDLVINAGLAGAIPPKFALADAVDFAIGDAVVVSEELFELDLETGKSLALPDDLSVHDRASSELSLVDRLVELGFPSVRGVTVGRVTATEDTAARLAALGAQVESMEGFPVLRAAEIAGVPAVEVRGISNRVGDRSKSNWDFSAGVTGLERILHALLPLALNIYSA